MAGQKTITYLNLTVVLTTFLYTILIYLDT